MAILYKGYAQQKGFSSYLVDVPDPSDKIRKQGVQAMGHMKDQIEWNNKQSQRVAQALEKNASLESKNNAENFELGSYLNEQKQKQINQGFDNRIAAEKQKIKTKENQIKNLLQITQSGRQIWKAYDAKQTEVATNWAKQGWMEHGIGLKKYRAIQDIEDEIWNDSSAREAALAKMGLDGVDITYLQTIRSASGYKNLAVAKQEARRWALQRPAYYAEHENHEFPLEGVGKVNLRDAVGPQVSTVLQLLDKKAIEDLKAAGGIEPSSKVLALSQSYQLLENARIQVHSQKAQSQKTEARKAQWHDEWTILDDSFNYTKNGLEEVNVGAGLIRAIEYYAGPNPTAEDYRRAKHRVFRAWEEGIKQGYWPTAKFKNIEDYEFDHSSGRTTIGNIFKREMLRIEDALVTGATRESGVAGLHIEQNRTQDYEFFEDLRGFEGNATDWSRKLAIATENGWERSRTYANNKLIRMADETSDKDVLAIVQGAVDANRYMTKAEVEELGGSPKATAIAMEMLQQNSQFLPDRYGHNDEIEHRVDRWLETLIPTPLTGAQDPSRSAAKTAAINIARSQYKAFMTKPGATPEAALEHALSYTKERVLKGEDFTPEFDDSLGGYVFPIGRIRIGAKELTLDDAAVANIIQKDRSRIYNTPFISPQALRIKSNNLNKGIQQELLPRSMFVESNAAGLVTALETEQAQIEYYNKILKGRGQPLIRPYPEWYIKKVKKQYDTINPESIRLLNKWDYCKINQAACQSGMNPTYTRPAYMKVRTIISSTLGTEGNLGWNFTDQGLSTKRDDLKKIHLTNATVGQILALQDKGLIQTAGRYQFTSDGLREAMEASGVSENTKFNADTQNKLFDVYFKKNGIKIINTLQNEEQRFLLLNIYEALNTQKLSNLGFNSPNTLSLAAYQELQRRGIYNAA